MIAKDRIYIYIYIYIYDRSPGFDGSNVNLCMLLSPWKSLSWSLFSVYLKFKYLKQSVWMISICGICNCYRDLFDELMVVLMEKKICGYCSVIWNPKVVLFFICYILSDENYGTIHSYSSFTLFTWHNHLWNLGDNFKHIIDYVQGGLREGCENCTIWSKLFVWENIEVMLYYLLIIVVG